MPFRWNVFSNNFDIVDEAGGLSPIIAINGDSGQATPDGNNEISILADDSTANNSNGITSVAGSSTVTITLTNRIRSTASTSGAASADLVTFDLSILTTAIVRFSFEVVCKDATAANGSGYTLTSTFLIAGGAATRINTPFSEDDESNNITDNTVNMVASGTNAILRVSGSAGYDLDRTAVGHYIVG
jgi:hypothetical protein